MYHIVLCDGDESFRGYIKRILLISGLEEEKVRFQEFGSGKAMLNGLADMEECHLCIFDIQMEGGDEAAKAFRKVFPSAVLVFCSDIFEATTQSFEAEPFRYLLKSYSKERMLEEIKAVAARVKQRKQTPGILIKSPEGMRRIKPAQILYIEIYKRGSRIYLYQDTPDNEKFVTTKRKLADLYQILKECGFAYAHRSYIVNIDYVKVMRFAEVQMVDGTVLSISRSREKDFRKAYMNGEYCSDC